MSDEPKLLTKESEHDAPLYSYDGEWWYDTPEEAKAALDCPGIITG